MMIEYMSTVILTGCGLEVCVATTGDKRRGGGVGGGGEIWKVYGKRHKEGERARKKENRHR